MALGLWLSMVNCNSYFYYPDNIVYSHPKDHRLQYKEVNFPSRPSSQILHAWFIYAQRRPSLGTIIQFHGNAQNLSSHYRSLLWVLRHGYNLFAFDYQGYGRSQGRVERKRTVQDGISAIQWVGSLDKNIRGDTIFIHGQSLGGAIAFGAVSSLRSASKIDGMIIESSFHSYQEIARDRLANTFIFWPLQWLAYFFISGDHSGDEIIDQLPNIPVLVVHGDKDIVVPIDFGMEIYKKLKKPKYFLKVKDGSHMNAFSEEYPQNRKVYLNFLKDAASTSL